MSRPRFSDFTALLLLVCGGVASTAFGHHALLSYDRSRVIETSGVIESVFWRNPHIRFEVRAADGEVWELEGPSVNLMERNDGVTQDLFAVGSTVTFIGMPSLMRENSQFPLIARLSSGQRVVMDRISAERLELVEEHETRLVPTGEAVDEATRSANGIFRVWTNVGRTFVRPPDAELPLTDAGRAAKAEWDQLEDDLAGQCISAGMPEAMVTPYPMEIISEGETIVIRLEEWDNVRTVYMQGDARPDTLASPHLGYSVGRWEDEVLVVSTTDIDYPYMDDRGTPLSAAAEVIGRFEMSEDEMRLDWHGILVDPETLTEPITLPIMHFEWHPGVLVKPYDCTLYVPPEDRVER